MAKKPTYEELEVKIKGLEIETAKRKQTDDMILKRAEEFAALYETSLDITKPHDLSSLLETIVERAAQLLNCPSGGMYLCDPDRKEVRCVVSYKTPDDYTGITLKYGEGAAGIVAQTKEPLIIDDYRTWPSRAAVYDKDQPFTAVISVPMIWHDDVTGIIHVVHEVETRRFTQSDLDLLTLFASQAATALNNTQLVGKVQSYAAELEKRITEIEERTAELEKVNEQLKKEIKERKRTEKALIEGESKYRSLFENMLNGFAYCKILLDENNQPIDFIYLEVNDSFEKLTGLRKEDVVGKKVTVAIPGIKETHPELINIYGKVALTGEETKFDIYFEPLEIWLSISVYSHQKGYFVAIFENITDRKQAEEAVRENEERYRDLYDNAPVMYHTIDTKGIVLDCNQTESKMLGYSKEEIIGKPIYAFQPKEYQDLATHALHDGMEKGHAAGERRFVKKNGTIIDTVFDATAIYDDSDQVVGFRSTITDITHLKRAEEALQESEEKYRSLVESTEDCIYLVDENLRYLFANKKIQSRFGLPMDKVIGRKYGDFHSKEETKNFAEKVNKVLETVQSLSYEYRSKRDNRYFIRTLSPVKEPDKKVTALTLISKDITKRKLAEESLKQANEKLLRAHAQRKILSKRLIDLLEKERRQIAMELHDDIGQTLTSLKIDIEMLNDQLKPFSSELRFMAQTAVDKTMQAMKDVKNVSHGLRPTMIDALGIVSSFRNLFSEIKQQTGMEIRFFNRGIPKRFEEEKELAIYRIGQESLTNVIRHARAKNVFVNLVKKGDNLSLSVEDDGVGFKKDKAMKTTRGKGPLGLLIMRERAIQLDGEFTIESQSGKGTHVLVEIPL